MTVLGYSQEGLPMYLDEDSAEVIYKGNKVPLSLIKSALESGFDRYQLTENITYEDKGGFISLACLELTKENFNQLFKKAWKLSKTYNTVGN
jgi:hypothetical protein